MHVERDDRDCYTSLSREKTTPYSVRWAQSRRVRSGVVAQALCQGDFSADSILRSVYQLCLSNLIQPASFSLHTSLRLVPPARMVTSIVLVRRGLSWWRQR